MKTVRKVIIRVVNFFFNLILPADFEMEELRSLGPDKIFALLRRISRQKYPGVFAIFTYKDALVRKMIWQMKFRECQWIAKIFGQFLAGAIEEKIFSVAICGSVSRARAAKFSHNSQDGKDDEEIFLIPIPLHPKRFAERGYNQCEWLCEEIMKNLGKTFLSKVEYNKKILRRVKYRTKQSWSSRAERLENSSGIFAVHDDISIVGRTFILIDDVVTTGATLNEARRTLLAAGASKVFCFVIAH